MRSSLALIALALALGGCADDNISVFVRHNIAPERSDDGCTWNAGSDMSVLTGTYDIGFNGDYRLSLGVVNQIQARASTTASEPNHVEISGAIVTLRNLGGEAFGSGQLSGLSNPFSVPASGFISAAPGPGMFGEGVVSMVGIPAAYGAVLAGSGVSSVVVSVELTGETLGHIDVHTDSWDWPVALCNGCLVACAAAADDAVIACQRGVDTVSLEAPGSPACPSM